MAPRVFYIHSLKQQHGILQNGVFMHGRKLVNVDVIGKIP